jgi:hypothetical protein
MSKPKSKLKSEEIYFGERLKRLEDEVVSLRGENESLRDEVKTMYFRTSTIRPG